MSKYIQELTLSGKTLSISGGNSIDVSSLVKPNADWSATSGDSQILNKPTFATVATTGNYNDLSNRPSIPSSQTLGISGNTIALSGGGGSFTIAGAGGNTVSSAGNVITITGSGGGGSTPSGTTFPATSSVGNTYYRTDLGVLYIYNGTAWISVSTGGSISSSPTPPAGPSVGDVYFDTMDSNMYYYDGTAWVMLNGTNTGTTLPVPASEGETFYNTTTNTFYVHDGTSWVAIGGGDMQKVTYDINNNGIVDKAETTNGATTGATTPATGTPGQLFYNTTDNTLYIYDGTSWTTMSAGGSIPSSPTPPAGPSVGDVYFDTMDSNMYYYDGTAWVMLNGTNTGTTLPVPASEGETFYNTTTNTFYVHDGTSWVAIGGGDMQKATYDINNNGIVDKAETTNGATTGATTPATGTPGQLFYNTTDNTLYIYDGTSWTTMSAGGSIPSSPTPPAGPSVGDVYFDTMDSNMYYYDGTAWVMLNGTNTGTTLPVPASEGETFYNTTTNTFYVHDGTSWVAIGGGDMQKVTYDINNNGIVDKAETTNGATTGATTPATGTPGQLFYNTTDNTLYIYDGTSWTTMSAGGSIPSSPTPPAGPSVGDVYFDTMDSNMYYYDGTAWVMLNGTNTGTTLPVPASEGETFYNTTTNTFYVHDGTSWVAIGGGDMQKVTYDINNNGIVDKAETTNGATTGATTPATGTPGQLFYNTTDNTLYIYDGTSWTTMSAGGSIPSSPTPPAGPSVGDVYFDTMDSNMYYYDGTAWVMLNGTNTGTTLPVPASEGETFYNTTTNTFYVHDGTSWVAIGGGDMQKATYDINNNGIVDKAETTNGATTGATTPATGTPGQLFYNTTDNTLYIYDGTSWTTMSAGGSIPSSPTPPAGPSVGDVYFDTMDSNMYYYDGTAWVMLNGTNTGTTLPVPASEGETFYNTTTNTFYVHDGTSWVAIGGGDMQKATYDINNNGIVDKAETTNGATTGATTPATGTPGQLFYNTTDNTLYIYDGTSWTTMSAGGSIPSSPTPPAGPSVGDVYFDTSDSNMYYYNGSAWIAIASGATTLVGDVTGTPAANTVSKIQGTSVSATVPTVGQVMVFDGSNWKPATSQITPGVTPPSSPVAGQTYFNSVDNTLYYYNGTAWVAITSGATTLAGDVIGTPAANTISAGAVTNSKLDKVNIPISGFGAATADVDLGSKKLTNLATPTATTDAATKAYVDASITAGAPDASTTNKGIVQLTGDLGGTATLPLVSKIQGTSVSATVPTVGQVMVFDGSNWKPATSQITPGVTPPSSPVAGQTYFNSVDNTLYYYNGTAWVAITSGATTLAGDVTGTPAANTVSKIQGTSVSATVPTVGQVMVFDGSNWKPATSQITLGVTPPSSPVAGQTYFNSVDNTLYYYNGTAWVAITSGATTLAGDVIGTPAANTVSKIQGTSVSATVPTVGQVMVFDGSNWKPATSQITPGVTPPSSPVAGQTYFNSVDNTLYYYNGTAWVAITSGATTLAGDVIGTPAANTVSKIQGTSVSATVPTVGQVMVFDGSNWKPATSQITPGVTPPSSPVAGQTYFNSVDNTLYYYNGTAWVAITSGATTLAGDVQIRFQPEQ